jgi:hypothetical protein
MLISRKMLPVLVAAALGAACSGAPKAQQQEAAKPAAPAAQASTAPAEGSVANVAEGDFGVPECDQFMKKYLTCIDDKVPEAMRPALKQALDQQKAAWQKAASTPEGKAALKDGCEKAEAQAKQSMAAYQCAW